MELTVLVIKTLSARRKNKSIFNNIINFPRTIERGKKLYRH
jgi:hypothetical protein